MNEETSAEPPADHSVPSDEVGSIWDQNAHFWDEAMGEGNDWHRELIAPAVEDLLGVKDGDRVLEVACGNGQLARRLVSLGARVVATDFAPSMLKRARSRTKDQGEALRYVLVDATDEKALVSLGEGDFDAVVCNMALMDMADVTPLARAVPRLLRSRGRFVFSVRHPCFNTVATRLVAEWAEVQGQPVVTRGVLTTRYLTPTAEKGAAMRGQPTLHWYFERPLGVLLRPFFDAGLALDAILEPSFAGPVGDRSHVGWRSVWTEIPPILVGRLRPLGATP